MSATIGVDLGGTAVRVSLVGADGTILARENAPTLSFGAYGTLLRWIAEMADTLRLSSGWRVSALGLAVPGILDPSRGCVVRSINVPMLDGREIGSHLEELTRLQVRLVTDADAATWGEWSALPLPPSRFAHLRLGTGVACGVIVGGALRPLERQPGRHADILIVERGAEDTECRCGSRGCLEAIASGAALRRRLSALGYAASLELLRTRGLVEAGDIESLRRGAVTGVDSAIDNLARRYGVEVVALGGGVMEAVPELFDAVADRRGARQGVLTDAPTPVVLRAALGDDAGVIGAGMLAREAPSATKSIVPEAT